MDGHGWMDIYAIGWVGWLAGRQVRAKPPVVVVVVAVVVVVVVVQCSSTVILVTDKTELL